ncbi:hypothetical protein DL96DRAFT_1613410 [Flagelloscypha sp. PMI_526]|nr:hypothetical protein DL96DRAFT_1613410 [Flagelloscypha sp. PMI_526]
MQTLESVLRTSAVQKPWVATCVRVLVLPKYFIREAFSQPLVTQALETFTELRALFFPSEAAFKTASPLPHLRLLLQIENASIPPCIAQHLTHLSLIGYIGQVIPQVLKLSASLQSLTHLLVVNTANWPYGFSQVADALLLIVPHGLPKALKLFAVNLGNGSHIFDLRFDKEPVEKAHKLLDADRRIVLWAEASRRSERKPRFFYQPGGGTDRELVYQCLEALPDGGIGVWQFLEQWIAEGNRV